MKMYPGSKTLTKRQAANFLRRAAKLIDQHGWAKGWYGNCNSGYCIMGALKVAVGRIGQETWTCAKAVGNYMFKSTRCNRIDGVYVWDIPAVNDRLMLSKEETIRLLRGTARYLEHGGDLV